MSPHIYYNALTRATQGDYVALAAAWNTHHDWHAAWAAVLPRTAINPAHEWEKILKLDVRLLLRDDDDFPPLLREIPHAPFGIYVKGDFIFNPPTIAVVGTRRATSEGKRLAETCARELALHGITIVSGLALGIDGAAHRGALAAHGKTIAVLPVGLNDIYPPHHRALLEQIVTHGGCVISEYPLGTPALPYRFLERNRIVSGLSLGTLVVEAPTASGALVTARLATEHNREVLVIPGPVSHPNYRGSHRLIREGAALVTNTEEIMEHMNFPHTLKSLVAPVSLSPEEQSVVQCITEAGAPLTLDNILALTTLELHAVHRAIALLTINGMIKESDGKYFL